MGNRGSKSAICESIVVKEQRVYGSWHGNSPCLRYTLTGFERNYPIKNPSNLIIHRRHYKGRQAFEDNNPTVNNKHITASIPNSKAIKAEVTYVNADTQKSSIFINNKGKSGIYR